MQIIFLQTFVTCNARLFLARLNSFFRTLLGRLLHAFEDDSESLIDFTQELTNVPLLRWDYCITSAWKTTCFGFLVVYSKKIIGKVPLAG